MAKDKRIKQYTLSDGKKKFMFRLYAGIDPMTGKKVKITKKGFNSEREAYTALIRLEVELAENGLPKKERKMTFTEIYQVWFENYKKTVKESTWSNTQRYFKNQILPDFGDKFINKIDVIYCQKTINKWSEDEPNRYKRFKNLATNVFQYAVSIGYIHSNPMTKIVVPRTIQTVQSNDEKFQFYNKNELSSFLSAAKDSLDLKEYLFFWILAYTGLRKGEALVLNWHDINFTQKTLTVSKTLSRGEKNKLLINTPKTKSSYRKISLDDTTISLLKTWKTTQKKDYFKLGINTLNKEQLIFPNDRNELYDPTITKTWLKRIYKHDSTLPKIGAHGLRHTHASLLFEAGASLKDVQDRLGHADIQTTANIYTHVTDKKKEETGNKFANYMGL